MRFNPLRHHRRSVRLRGYDYSAEGAYSVTFCTRNRECTLGDAVNEEMILSETGRIADACWLAIPGDFLNVTLDEYRVMPNHVHGIVVIWDRNVGDLVGKGNPVKDMIGDGDSGTDFGGKDLINQIPPGDEIPPGHQMPPGNQIPFGLSIDKFSNEINWPLMKNPKETLGKIIRHFKAKARRKYMMRGFQSSDGRGTSTITSSAMIKI